MSEKVAVTQSYLQDTADAISEKTGSTDTYKPSEFAAAIRKIQSGASVDTCTVKITAGGTIGGLESLVYVTVDEDGKMTYSYKRYSESTSATITDCVCNTILCAEFAHIATGGLICSNATDLHRLENLSSVFISAPAGGTATLYNEYGDTSGSAEPANL